MLTSFIFCVALAAISCSAESDDNSTLLEERQIPNDNPCNCYFKESCGCICSRPISWGQFQILPQNFQPCRSFTLALRGGQFYSFPADYFYRVGHVQDFVLDVSRVAFQYLNDPDGDSSPYNGVTFDVSAYLRMHEVSVSRGWNWGAMYWLAPTTAKAYCEIQVVQSTVPILNADFGRICQGVVTVANIISSGLYSIENYAFAPFTKLTEIDLSSNRIQDMRRSFFSYPAADLQIMNLSYNNIRTLPPDMFTQMPSLQSINLRGNPISNVDQTTFRPIFRTVEIIGLENESLLHVNTTHQ
ncbi:hypothetical protein AVEN_264144-1 [Araneus ventricosus]|uniref:Uncharacterized protein n=1 Tax=Araneus ventricosus TaxID=182803 RepID=A0A4Y2HAX2_ARAVE|nr:hypothetical protein AVEN_264144-1 [Araneus ventricosus]